MKKILLFVLFFLLSIELCSAGISVIGGLTREKTVKPGEKVEGIILLKNSGEGLSEVKVYKTDYLFSADGKNIYGEPGSIPRSNSRWITLSPNRLTLNPGETVSVHYTVQVPDIPDMTGTYWSMIMVEPIPETSPLIRGEKGKARVGVQTIIRYGIQIVTDMSNTGTRKVRFLDKKLISEKGNRILQIDIENTGERWLSPLVWIELYNIEGINLGRFESGRMRVYPGCSVRHKVDLTNVPKGMYKSLVIADNGDEYIFGAQYDLEIK